MILFSTVKLQAAANTTHSTASAMLYNALQQLQKLYSSMHTGLQCMHNASCKSGFP
jgi:hypothetical protein